MNEALSSPESAWGDVPGAMTLYGIPVLLTDESARIERFEKAPLCEGKCGMRIAMARLGAGQEPVMCDVQSVLKGDPVKDVYGNLVYGLAPHTVQRCRELRERNTPERGE